MMVGMEKIVLSMSPKHGPHIYILLMIVHAITDRFLYVKLTLTEYAIGENKQNVWEKQLFQAWNSLSPTVSDLVLDTVHY